MLMVNYKTGFVVPTKQNLQKELHVKIKSNLFSRNECIKYSIFRCPSRQFTELL